MPSTGIIQTFASDAMQLYMRPINKTYSHPKAAQQQTKTRTLKNARTASTKQMFFEANEIEQVASAACVSCGTVTSASKLTWVKDNVLTTATTHTPVCESCCTKSYLSYYH